MFRKSFTVKNLDQLRSSEKKKFVSDLKEYFPTLDMDAFVTFSGDDIAKMRIVTHNREVVFVWLVARVPMFFCEQRQNILAPTLQMCWAFPEILTKVTTHDHVVQKLQNGADLFIPGVYMNTKETIGRFFKPNEVVAINTATNAAPIAVGICTMEGSKGLQAGKFATILHTYNDFLHRHHNAPLPNWGPVEMKSSNGSLEKSSQLDSTLEDMAKLNLDGQLDTTTSGAKSTETQNSPESFLHDGDALLKFCFLKGLKKTQDSDLPILPSNLYANFMLPSVPDTFTLDVRKTSWKKLHVFLKAMADLDLVVLQTVRPNEYLITGIDRKHSQLIEFYDPFVEFEPEAPTQTVTLKANISPIVFDVITRAGNKKVTTITNLYEYGVDVNSFAKKLQLNAAASSMVVEATRNGKKVKTIQVQGNQIRVAMKMIQETYGIGVNHMRGIEKAPKVRR